MAALALPLLTTSARAAPVRFRATSTGAAWNTLDVNTPPTVVAGVEKHYGQVKAIVVFDAGFGCA